MTQAISIGHGAAIPYRYMTRHAGIFGATGTGKTTTLGAIAERCPCPVLILDVKGDLESLGDTIQHPAMPIDAMGAELITRALDLSDAQAGALYIVMTWASDTGKRCETLADLRDLFNDAMTRDLSGDYGLVSAQSVAAVQRSLLRLECATPWVFQHSTFDPRKVSGRVVIKCGAIAETSGLYGAYAAHMLDSLYRGLAELGDVESPGLMVLIDESHLIFDGATAAIVRRLEQIARLIRSKGVGLIFVTQSPSDLPDAIAGQLATRVQHGMRGATPRQQKAIRAAAETMPGNATAESIMRLATGCALVSVPDASGRISDAREVRVTRGTIALHPVDIAPPSAAPGRKIQRQAVALPDVAPRFVWRWWYWLVLFFVLVLF